MSALGQELFAALRSVRAALASGETAVAADAIGKAEALAAAAARAGLPEDEVQLLLQEHALGVLETQDAFAKLLQRSEDRSTFERARLAYARRSRAR